MAAPAEAVQSKLTVFISNGPGGRVVTSPPGIDCAVQSTASQCSAFFDGDSTVSVSFVPDTSVVESLALFRNGGVDLGYLSSASVAFRSGASYADQSMQVVPIPMTPIQLLFCGSGSGQVTSDPTGLSCSSACSAYLHSPPWGSVQPPDLNPHYITLSAMAQAGSVFSAWSGYCASGSADPRYGTSGATSTIRFFASPGGSPKACEAKFDLAPTLTVATSGSSGIVTSLPGGIACRTGSSSDCARSFLAGTTVSLTATADSGYRFTGWSGACSGTATAVSVTVNSATSCTASFAQGPDPTITTAVYGSGTITGASAGISCPGGACAATIPWGSSVTLVAAPTAGASLVEWTGAGTCTGSALTVTLADVRVSTSCGVRFEAAKKLTVSLPGSGVGTVTASSGGLVCSSGSCTADYAYRETVTLTATPTSGSTFESWGGSCSGTGQTVSVTMLSDQTCTANFKSDQKRLTVTLAGTGAGLVTSVPSKITCSNVPVTSTCAATFDTGATVVLTAIAETPSTENPYDESRFDGWGGACTGTAATTSVRMSVARDCTATFIKLKSGVTLTVTLAGAKSGTVISTPSGITCTPTTLGRQCVGRYAKDTAVSLDVTPGTGARFFGWSGACTGRTSPLPLTLTENKSCTATFSAGAIVPEVGSWWNATESGRGYGIEVQYTNGDPKIFFGAFAYTPAGPPIWYISFLTPTDDGTGFSGPLTSYTGGQTLLGAFQAPVGPATVGVAGQTLKLAFTSPTVGSITFPPLTAFATGSTVAISRFPIISGGLSNARATSPVLPQTGWWWNTAEPGRGVFFEAQADTAGNQILFTLFFLYGSDGSPRWYFGSTALVPSGGAWAAPAMAFYECSGGQAIGSPTPEVAQCTAVAGGTATVQFDTVGATATMTLSTGTVVSLTRFAF